MEFHRWSKDGSKIPRRSEMKILPPESSDERIFLPSLPYGSIDRRQKHVSMGGLHELLLHAGEVLQREDGDLLADGKSMRKSVK